MKTENRTFRLYSSEAEPRNKLHKLQIMALCCCGGQSVNRMEMTFIMWKMEIGSAMAHRFGARDEKLHVSLMQVSPTCMENISLMKNKF